MTLDEILETRFCCQTKCPHIGDDVTCRECKTEKYKELYGNSGGDQVNERKVKAQPA